MNTLTEVCEGEGYYLLISIGVCSNVSWLNIGINGLYVKYKEKIL